MDHSGFLISHPPPAFEIEFNFFGQAVVRRRRAGEEDEIAQNWAELEPEARAYLAERVGVPIPVCCYPCPQTIAVKATWSRGAPSLA
jgi:hypothetical protein